MGIFLTKGGIADQQPPSSSELFHDASGAACAVGSIEARRRFSLSATPFSRYHPPPPRHLHDPAALLPTHVYVYRPSPIIAGGGDRPPPARDYRDTSE